MVCKFHSQCSAFEKLQIWPWTKNGTPNSATTLKEHGGFLEDTPRLTTGNGGLHILFSLSQSEQAGLRNCGNRARIHYKGEPVGIDTRGRGGG
jgi:hypothetical protein